MTNLFQQIAGGYSTGGIRGYNTTGGVLFGITSSTTASTAPPLSRHPRNE
jgi:hypothetical protein